MTNSLLLGFALLFGWLAVHSFTTYPLSILLFRSLFGEQASTGKPGRSPSIAVCVCAYNESPTIREKLGNLCKIISEYPGEATAYVYDDCSSDNTPAILSAFEDRITVVYGQVRSGKSCGMNSLLELVDTELVVFSDANVRIADDALSVFASYFQDDQVGCVCGSLEYFDAITGAAKTSSLYWRLEELTKQWESDTGSVIGADGSLFAIRRHLFREVPFDIMDDFFTSLSVLCEGYQVKRAGDAKAFERAAQGSKEEFSRKKRIACRAFNCFRHLWPRLRKTGALNLYKLFSHKLLRWTSFAWLLLSLFFFGWFLLHEIGPDLTMVLTAVALTLLGIGYRSNLPVLKQLLEVILSLAGAGLGVLQSIRGFRYQTWEPAATSRQKREF